MCSDQFVYVSSQWETTLQCNVISHWLATYMEWSLCSDHFVYASNQWKTMLQCNVMSNWLAAYTEWSLYVSYSIRNIAACGRCHFPVLDSLVLWRCIINFKCVISKHMLGIKLISTFCQMNATGPHWWLINTGSGSGLFMSGNKPLPEPMLT